MSADKKSFIAEQLGERKAAELSRPERVEIIQAFNREFYPDKPTNYRGCPAEQIAEVHKLLGLDAPAQEKPLPHFKAAAQKPLPK